MKHILSSIINLITCTCILIFFISISDSSQFSTITSTMNQIPALFLPLGGITLALLQLAEYFKSQKNNNPIVDTRLKSLFKLNVILNIIIVLIILGFVVFGKMYESAF